MTVFVKKSGWVWVAFVLAAAGSVPAKDLGWSFSKEKLLVKVANVLGSVKVSFVS